MSLRSRYGSVGKPTYRAATLTEGGVVPWLLVPYTTGDIELLPAGGIKAIAWEAQAPHFLAIVFDRGRLKIAGEHLSALLRLLHSGRVAELHLADEIAFAPPQPGEPLIDRIEWIPGS